MLENPEARSKLRRKLETWPDHRPGPVSINQALELLDMLDCQAKELIHMEHIIKEWRKRFKNRGRKNKSLKRKNALLEREADWLADEIGICSSALCEYSRNNPQCDNRHCGKCWRKRASLNDWKGVYPDGIKSVQKAVEQHK